MVGGFDVVTLVVVNAVCDVAGVADVITFVVLDVDVMAAVELDAWLQAANVKITDNKPRPMQKIFFFISFLLFTSHPLYAPISTMYRMVDWASL